MEVVGQREREPVRACLPDLSDCRLAVRCEEQLTSGKTGSGERESERERDRERARERERERGAEYRRDILCQPLLLKTT